MIDFNNTGAFGGYYDDVSADVVGQVQTLRGKDRPGLIGRTIAGKAQFTLRNASGRYSLRNVNSPLYGVVLPDLLVQINVVGLTAGTLFSGKIDEFVPTIGPGGEPAVIVRCSGVLKSMGVEGAEVYPAAYTGLYTGEIIANLLALFGWANRGSVIGRGQVPIFNYFKGPDGVNLLAGLQEMEDAEIGSLRENTVGGLYFEDRYYRDSAPTSRISQALFSDNPASNFPYSAPLETDASRQVYNRAVATVNPYTPAETAEVIAALGGGPFYLAPLESREFTITPNNGYVNPWLTPVPNVDLISEGGVDYTAVPGNTTVWSENIGYSLFVGSFASLRFRAIVTNGYVGSWVTPVAGVDVTAIPASVSDPRIFDPHGSSFSIVPISQTPTEYVFDIINTNSLGEALFLSLVQVRGQLFTANGQTIVTVTPVSQSGAHYTYRVTNPSATAGIYLTRVAARGQLYTKGTSSQVVSQDDVSIARYKRRNHPFTSPYYQNEAYAKAATDWTVQQNAYPKSTLSITIESGTAQQLADLAVYLDISMRITVEAQYTRTRMGLYADWFIDQIAHTFGPGGIPWRTTYYLSLASAAQNWWVLGDPALGVLGVTSRLAY